MKRVYQAVVCGALLAAPMLANATPSEFTLPSLPTGQIYTIGGTILGGLATMWALRKLIKTVNKS